MFKLSLLSVILFSSLGYAQSKNCIDDLCIGEIIIDSGNYVGVVVGFTENEVVYRRSGYSSNSSSFSSQLSEKIESSKLPVGSFVIDESSYVGQVKNVFTDGRVEYRREGYGRNSISSSVSPEILGINGIEKDVYVIDESDYVGKTHRVFENGKTQYLREGYNNFSISSSVSAEIPRIKGISKNVKVIDESNYVGIAKRVFSNGKFQYTRNGYGSASISSVLTPEVKELNNIVTNKNVMDESNYSGIAKNVFADGRVEYRRDGYRSNSISPSLVHEIPELKNGTKAGTVVLDQSNYVGTVKIIYNDGRILYRRNGYGSNTVGSELAYEVDKNDKYQKGVEYASPSHTIGDVSYFFSNKKIELSGSKNVICDELFESVDELDNIKVGTEVIQPGGAVVVEKIFANYTARAIIDREEEAIQILTQKQIEDQGRRQQWLYSLGTILEGSSIRMGTNIAVREEDYKKLLDLLKKDLDIPHSIGLSKDTIKKICEHIDSELKKIEK